MRKLKARRSSSGASAFCSLSWRSTNTARLATPITSAAMAAVLGSALAAWPPPIWLRPYTRPPNAGTVRSTERKSSLVFSVSPTFVRYFAPMARAASATGRTKTNIKRHVKCSRISPETVGPMAGATEIAMLTLPMTAPRLASGTSVRMVVISSGSMMAVPPAWMMRARSRISKPGATAASAVPPAKRPMASIKTARVDRLCRMNPVVGMTTAMVSIKPVESHCTVGASTPRSTISRCRATFMMVSFRITTKVATSRVAMMVTDSRDSFSGAEDFDADAWPVWPDLPGGPGWPEAFEETSVDMGVPSGSKNEVAREHRRCRFQHCTRRSHSCARVFSSLRVGCLAWTPGN